MVQSSFQRISFLATTKGCSFLNQISPTELGLCVNLQILRVHRTDITGTMPREVCTLRDKFLCSNDGTGVLYADCGPNNGTTDPFLQCACCSDNVINLHSLSRCHRHHHHITLLEPFNIGCSFVTQSQHFSDHLTLVRHYQHPKHTHHKPP